jgi:catechol 2,3-dioxygenase-like lactoylglutathione lyase family enzyme
MSKTNTGVEPISHERREVIRAAGVATLTGVAASSLLASASPATAQQTSNDRDSSPLGARLQGAQHFGLTVQNMDRAFEFYTEVLGGSEVMRDGDFHGAPIHNTLMTDQEIIARELKVDPRTIGVPDLKGGAQRLDVRFVQFDNFVIELLQYREAEQPMGNGDSWAEPRDHMSPAYPRSMHICFYIRDDVNFAKFISDLEAECARRGMTQVRRTVSFRWKRKSSARPPP